MERLTRGQQEEAAERLWQAAESHGKTAPPSRRYPGFSLEDGYAVAALLAARRIAQGGQRAGLKIGFTNTAVWERYGLDCPICAPVYRATVFAREALGDHPFPVGGLVEPRIEPEIVFGIGEGVIDWWALGFEIVQCHYPRWDLQAADAIADFGLHAALIVGEPRLFTPQAAARSAEFSLELLRDGTVVERGVGSDVLGGPLSALDRLVALTGEIAWPPPAPGEVVTTGSLTAAPFIAAGELWEARIAGAELPALRMAFA